MSKNKNLHTAKTTKNDEFYTLLSDIENELKYYKHHFKGKTVYCNCDDPKESNFFKYFALNFEHLGLKKLITTYYSQEGKQSYQLIVEKDINDDGKINMEDTISIPLKGNGDFRSEESIRILKQSDVIVTNPPFSLFREYVKQLMDYNKEFLIIGSMNAITYKEIFKYIKENKLWLGFTSPKNFKQPDGTEKKFGNINWYTNLEHDKRNEELILYMKYEGNEDYYPRYDNYNAIEVSKVKEIPKDYSGYMGIPITFLGKYNPEQFSLYGIMNTGEKNEGIRYKNTKHGRPIIKGKEKYLRILIKNKKLNKI